jgi:hypothetical protein
VSDAKLLLERQAGWQRARQALTWPEKVRMAEQVRESVLQLRRSARGVVAPGRPAPTEGRFGRPKRP